MKSYVIYHVIHIHTPHQYHPKLVITDVPDEVDLSEEDVNRGGYEFGEFGMAWANHSLRQIADKKDLPAELVAKLHGDGYRTVSYDDLVNKPLPFEN